LDSKKVYVKREESLFDPRKARAEWKYPLFDLKKVYAKQNESLFDPE